MPLGSGNVCCHSAKRALAKTRKTNGTSIEIKVNWLDMDEELWLGFSWFGRNKRENDRG